jgi:peptidoglycan glycosyltransferase
VTGLPTGGLPAGGLPQGAPRGDQPDGVAPQGGTARGNRQGGAGKRPGIGVALGKVALALTVAFGGLAAGAGYWQVVRSSDLSSSPDDAAVIAASRHIVRGEISDREGTRLAWSISDANGEPQRKYLSRAFSGVIGYASPIYGTAGLERAYQAQLIGITPADPVQDLVKKFRANASDPQAIRTTLVARLQEAATTALGADRGAVVMLDPRTGEILALASTPFFDASALADPDTATATMAALQADKAKPLLPRATQGRYVPGSVFKIVTAIAGLGSGAIGPDTTFPEQPPAEKTGLLVDGFRVRDGHHTVTGTKALDFVEATEVSCNIWFALAGLRTGGDALASWAGKLGFGEPIPFDLPTSASQVTNGGGSFGGGFTDAVELANAAYGQAETVVTPLQMALVASTVANGGVLMKPHLVQQFTGRGGTTTVSPEVWQRILSLDVAQQIGGAMEQAVNGSLGRGFTTGAQVKGLTVAGKSGTAELGGTGEPNSWFIGFAPAGDAQVAIAVVVEQGGRGAERAAPIAGTLLAAWKAWAGQ